MATAIAAPASQVLGAPVALRAGQVVQAPVVRAVKVVPVALAVPLVRAAQAMTASVSRGLAMASPETGPPVPVEIVPNAMVSVSRGLAMGNPRIVLRAQRVMVSVSRGPVMASRAIDQREMASVSRGLVMASRAIDQREMGNESPGPVMGNPVTVSASRGRRTAAGQVPRGTLVPRVMASASRGHAIANQVNDHPGPEEIARSETPAPRVRAATALSAITKPTR